MIENELFARIGIIVHEIQILDRLNPTGPDEDAGPRIQKLLAEGARITQQLDPLIRARFRDDPAKLAEWDEIVHMCGDLDEDSLTE